MGIKGESHLATSPYPHGHGWAGQILFSRSELSYREFLARNMAEFEFIEVVTCYDAPHILSLHVKHDVYLHISSWFFYGHHWTL